MRRTISLAGITMLLASGAALAPAEAAVPGERTAERTAVQQPHSRILLVQYRARAACTIYPNYPKAGVKGNRPFSTIPAGRAIVWRYNVNSTWAMVQHPTRARAKQFPWWGFTRKSCIGPSIKTTRCVKKNAAGKCVKKQTYPAGRPVPNRILQARSQAASGWRRVMFTVPAGKIVSRNRGMRKNATLRDPAHLVIGNVPSNWRVHVTNQRVSGGAWTKVLVPNARRWGYVETGSLRRR